MPFKQAGQKKQKVETLPGSIKKTPYSPFKAPKPSNANGPWLTSAAVTKLLGRVDEVAGKVEELMDLIEGVLPPADLDELDFGEEDEEDTGGDTEEYSQDEEEASQAV